MSGVFRCGSCRARVEVFQILPDNHPSAPGGGIRIRCPSCGKEEVIGKATWRTLNPPTP